jgi:hypothetical protein
MEKYKYIEFEDLGPYCVFCGESASFEGCHLHAGTFPIISAKNRLRIPICTQCRIECHECGSSLDINEFKVQHTKLNGINTNRAKFNKVEAKAIKVSVKQDTIDILEQLRHKPHSENIRYFQDSITNILNEVTFSLEVGSQFAIRDIEDKLKEIIPSDMRAVKNYINKLSSLLLLLQLTRAVGLGSYEKEIVHREITKLFGPAASTRVKGKLGDSKDLSE